MSAFVVENKTINRVIGYLNNNRRDLYRYFDDVLKAVDLTGSEDDWHEKLGASMLLMNQDAVNYRYNEGNYAEHFKFRWEMDGTIQVLKSLQCYLYQCSEGDIPDRPLYKALRELEYCIMGKIIDRMPEYDRAQWA